MTMNTEERMNEDEQEGRNQIIDSNQCCCSIDLDKKEMTEGKKKGENSLSS